MKECFNIKRNAILDLDGTLNTLKFNNDCIMRNYSEKQRLMRKAIPFLNAKLVLDKLAKKYHIFIVSGRNEKDREITMKWLNKYQFHFDTLILMRNQWENIKEYYDYKLMLFKKLNQAFIIEDDKTIIDMSNRIGILTFAIEDEISWNQIGELQW
jgi:phosphoglycolate phosphatase-like HAD superfamily hydrolase